jgi:hypothetical protein
MSTSDNDSVPLASTVNDPSNEKDPVILVVASTDSEKRKEEDHLESGEETLEKSYSSDVDDDDDESFSSQDDDDKHSGHTHKSNVRWPWASWVRGRVKTTFLGCLSSAVVLIIRLLLDREPTAYVIHSVIILIDMVLIHLFTHSPWLSVSGEVTTVIFFLAFHFTKETVFELLETTIIAALCSFHMIAARNKHRDREEELEVGVQSIRRQTLGMLHDEEQRAGVENLYLQTCSLLHSASRLEAELSAVLEEQQQEEVEVDISYSFSLENDTTKPRRRWFVSHHHDQSGEYDYRQRIKTCGSTFFENFLDGSAGVMYTSFLGLIIDELIQQWGTNQDKY